MTSAYDIRTKSTIEDGKTSRSDEGGSIQYYDYQPGNGTRYSLIFVRLDPTENPNACEGAGVGREHGGWMVTWTTKRQTMFLAGSGFIHYTYVAEKLGVGISDAIVLAEFIGHVTGRSAISCVDFDPDTLAQDTMTS